MTATVLAMVFLSCTQHSRGAENVNRDPNTPSDPTIALATFQVGEGKLEIQYDITNGSMDDIWVCTGMTVRGMQHAEAFVDRDGHTLVIGNRLDVPLGAHIETSPSGSSLHGCHLGTYTRLKSGECRRESLSLDIPIHCRRIASSAEPTGNTIYVDRLLLQIGFCKGSLPTTIRGVLKEAERVSETYPGQLFLSLARFGGGRGINVVALYQLNAQPETLTETTNHVIIPYAAREIADESVLQIHVDGLHIPYTDSPASEDMSGVSLHGSGGASDEVVPSERRLTDIE